MILTQAAIWTDSLTHTEEIAHSNMAEPSDANKRQKPEDAVPAFSDTISNFAVEETLRFEAGGRLAVVLGKLGGQDCVLEIKQRAALADPRALEDALPKLKLALTNHSGAEYSYYAATDPTTGATYDLEAVWPRPSASSSASGPPRSASSRRPRRPMIGSCGPSPRPRPQRSAGSTQSVPVWKSSASGRPGGIIYYSGRLDAARECLESSHEAS